MHKPIHYRCTQEKYISNAHQIYKDFIVDELGERFERQLHYEAACTSLKEIKTSIDAMPQGKQKRQATVFYEEKLKELQSIAHRFQATPYTL
jgi:hypothetical protein